MTEAYRFSQTTRTDKEQSFAGRLNDFIAETPYSNFEKFQNFPLFTSRQDITRYLAKYELFKMIVDVHGVIIEGGCLFGGGTLWWHHLSSIMEPTNHVRRVIGFDTFEGFPSLTEKESKASDEAKVGGLAVDSYEVIQKAAEIHDTNRPIGHLPKLELRRGDACKEIPHYTEEIFEPVALLYCDFDVESPTKTALEYLVPRMPRGAVIGFDECHRGWGEAKAVIEYFCEIGVTLRRFPWASTISYCVVE